MSFLSIVVPTKNRAYTLRYCLQTLLNQHTRLPYEVVVSDNRSHDDTQNLLGSIDDQKLKVFKPPRRLGMTEHWEWALSQASGDWVTIVGDDDGLMPNAVDKIYSASRDHDVRVISSKRHNFVWPMEDRKSSLSVRPGHGESLESTKKNLALLLRGYFSHKNLPWIYTGGFVRRDAIDDLRKRRGTVFKSISPDLCSAISLSLQETEYLYLHDPIAIGGTSRFSNGYAQMNSSRKNDILRDFYEESTVSFLPELGDGHVQSLSLLLFEAFKANASDFENTSINPSLAYQLALAVIMSKKGFENDVEQYCRAIAEHSGVRWSSVMALAFYRRCESPLIRILLFLLRRSKLLSGRRTVKAVDGVVEDIYSASREAFRISCGLR